jgi:hypothetical protein
MKESCRQGKESSCPVPNCYYDINLEDFLELVYYIEICSLTATDKPFPSKQFPSAETLLPTSIKLLEAFMETIFNPPDSVLIAVTGPSLALASCCPFRTFLVMEMGKNQMVTSPAKMVDASKLSHYA